MTTVFISSTYTDLAKHRKAVFDTLEPHFALRNMENFGSSGMGQVDTCLAALKGCNAMVLILGFRYGSVLPTSGTSFTEIEYEYAQGTGIPVFAYVRKDFDEGVAASTESQEQKAKLGTLRGTVEHEVTVEQDYFGDPADLASKVVRDLRRWQPTASARPKFRRTRTDIRNPIAYASEIARRAGSELLAPTVVLVDLSAAGLPKTPDHRHSRLTRKLLEIETDLRNKGYSAIVFTNLPATGDSDDQIKGRLGLLQAAGEIVVVFFAKNDVDIDALEEFLGDKMTRFVWYRDEPPSDSTDVYAARPWIGEHLTSCQLAIDVETDLTWFLDQAIVSKLGSGAIGA